MTVTPTDSLITPITTQLIAVTSQIAGVGRTYPAVPDGPPEDNSVMYPCKHIEVVSGTNGRLDLRLTFDIVHCFRRNRLQESLGRCYTVMPAWLTVLGSYANIRLSNSVTMLELKSIDIKEVSHGGQSLLGVVSTVVVWKEFAIPTS